MRKRLSDRVATSRWTISARLAAVDSTIAATLQPLALPALRMLLGSLFLWFGGLKVAGASPVEAIVAGTLPWMEASSVVIVLGIVEVVLGVGLISGVAVRLLLHALVAHLTGTFLTFVMLPDMMYRSDNPLLLTESGEFVAKNVVLIGAALVLIAHKPRQSGGSPARPID